MWKEDNQLSVNSVKSYGPEKDSRPSQLVTLGTSMLINKEGQRMSTSTQYYLRTLIISTVSSLQETLAAREASFYKHRHESFGVI